MEFRHALTPYQDSWTQQFEGFARKLVMAVAEGEIEVHHIGSTSVPSLAARPIIDVMVVLKSPAALGKLEPLLAREGAIARGEFGLPGRNYFTIDDAEQPGKRCWNIHIFPDGHPDIERHIAFRDYLRMHDSVARDYEKIKQDALDASPTDMKTYGESKSAWIDAVEAKAIRWVFEGK